MVNPRKSRRATPARRKAKRKGRIRVVRIPTKTPSKPKKPLTVVGAEFQKRRAEEALKRLKARLMGLQMGGWWHDGLSSSRRIFGLEMTEKLQAQIEKLEALIKAYEGIIKDGSPEKVR